MASTHAKEAWPAGLFCGTYGSSDVERLASLPQDASPWLELFGEGATGWCPGDACSQKERPVIAPARTARTSGVLMFVRT